jgi:hypothetical protein
MRFCNLCNQSEIGDEWNYILECKLFSTIRKYYIDTYFIKRPSAIKFGHLMKKKNIKLNKICSFMKVINKAVRAPD